MTKQTVLYVDGQNFLTRLRGILRRRGVQNVDLRKFDFWGLLNSTFKNERVDLAQIYFAKLHGHRDTPEKSKELLEREEGIKSLLEGQGFRYITAGSVRPRKRDDTIVFEEKGVDIRIAVDIVKDVIDGAVGKVLLASSDSDLQPAVYEARHRGALVWYVGFQSRPNRGLMLTTDRYVLLSNDAVATHYKETADAVAPTVPSQPKAPAQPSSHGPEFNEPPWARHGTEKGTNDWH